MFDAKKLLDALGAPAKPADGAPAAPAESAKAASAEGPKPADAPKVLSAIAAGSILSDLIAYANSPAADASEDAAKPAKPAPPSDLTDLLLGHAQTFFKSPQGNAIVASAVFGLSKFVANSPTGRKIGATAMSKGSALLDRLKKPIPTKSAAEASSPEASTPEAAASATSAETTLLVMRAMIAAAAADGRIDDSERQRIRDSFAAAGIEGDAAKLIEHELEHPATAADLAMAAKTPEMAVQAYTAARRVITPNSVDERVFLAHLSAALGLAPHIVAQIDASAAGPA